MYIKNSEGGIKIAHIWPETYAILLSQCGTMSVTGVAWYTVVCLFLFCFLIISAPLQAAPPFSMLKDSDSFLTVFSRKARYHQALGPRELVDRAYAPEHCETRSSQTRCFLWREGIWHEEDNALCEYRQRHPKIKCCWGVVSQQKDGDGQRGLCSLTETRGRESWCIAQGPAICSATTSLPHRREHFWVRVLHQCLE